MQRDPCAGGGGSNSTDQNHGKAKKKRWLKGGNLLSKQVGSIISSMFGRKKFHMGYYCKGERNDNHKNLSSGQIVKRVELNDKSFGDQRLLEVMGGEKNEISLSKFLKKSTTSRFNEVKAKAKGSCSCLGCNGTTSDGILMGRQGSGQNYLRRVTSNASGTVIRRQPSKKSSLPRVPSRTLTTRQRLKMARSMRRTASRRIERELEQDEGEEDKSGGGDDHDELCKKRILMGGKCKPLNHSGTLSYDGDGILLPEI